ncbi:MAG: outer membrane lipoprotein carrier protein LolA, partial [Alphaproteobacteria bacterium]|nr:outer membrane lipoprotein carrier protein LolA [Alphaproteobacteria bacterium]
MFRIRALAVVFLLALPAAAHAAVPPAPQPVDAQVVGEVGRYLNGLSTLKAHFVQTAADGKQLSGTFYLKRPGRMRITYDPPDKDLIVADGLFIHYYDSELQRTSSALISRSTADFFLRKHLDLSGGDIIVSAAAAEGDTLTVTVEQAKNPLAGSLTLTLGQAPLRLLSWRVVDAEGLTTTVALS